MDHIVLTSEEKIPSCSICHQPLAYFGNLPLKNGMICKDCLKKVSTWLSEEDIARLSVRDMHRHLIYRMTNQEALQDFQGVKIIDGACQVYANIQKHQFVICKNNDYLAENADLFHFSTIKEVNVKEESYLDSDNIDVILSMKLGHKEIHHLQFRVNEFPGLSKSSNDYPRALDQSFMYLKAFMIMNNRHNQITLRKDNENE